MVIHSRAPLRISFAGGGTDVSPFPETEGGLVLSATIDRYAYASIRRNNSGSITLRSVDFDLVVNLGVAEHFEKGGELDLLKAAIYRLGGHARGGFDLLVESAAPPGSGLGSSSTVMVALIGALARHYGLESLDEYHIARTAWEVERHDLGILGGKQDHYAAAFGGFNFIEFDNDQVLVNPLRIKPEVVDELQHNLLLAYTGLTRASSRVIRDQTERVELRERDVIDALRTQKSLAIDMKRALLTGRLDDFAGLLDSAWTEKKRLSPIITNEQIDNTYDLAKRNGAIGGKVTGAGGGGYILLYCDFWKRHKVVSALEAAGVPVSELAFSRTGVKTWETLSE